MTSKQVAVMLVPYSFARVGFLHKVRFDTSSTIPLRSPPNRLPDCLTAFSLNVHHKQFTPFAAKSGLTTPPAQRCRYLTISSLPYRCIISFKTCSVYYAELHGTSKVAQREERRKIGYKVILSVTATNEIPT
jgi:hypothetical protein